jgi:large subunit ribosomal protein L10
MSITSHPLLQEEQNLNGPNGIVFSYEDPAATAKVLYAAAKDDKALKIKIGVMDNKILNVAELETLSKLPSRQELLGQVAATMQAPISGFVNVCAGVIRGFVNCVNEVKKQKEQA